MTQSHGLGLCAYESSGEIDESSGVGPECLHPCAWGDGNAAGPQTTLRLGIGRPVDHCSLFLATKYLPTSEMTTEPTTT